MTKGRHKGVQSFGWQGAPPEQAEAILEHVYINGLYLDANYARENRFLIAMLASAGYISTVEPSGRAYGRVWRITPAGLSYLQSLSEVSPK